MFVLSCELPIWFAFSFINSSIVCLYNIFDTANTISRQQPCHLKTNQAEGGDGDTNYTHVFQTNTKTSSTFTLLPHPLSEFYSMSRSHF